MVAARRNGHRCSPRRAVRLALQVALLLGGCEREAPPVQHAPAPAGGVVRRLDADVGTWNYVLQTSEDERQILAYLYDPLIACDQNLEPMPSVAARWEIADGGRTYILHLDPRATFSDGSPVTARDVLFTLTKILDAPSPQFASWFEHLNRAETKVVDPRTIRVVFSKPRAGQLLAFTIGVLPEHVYGRGTFAAIQDVVGNGPYRLLRHERGRSVHLERRADYWRTPPSIPSVVFRVVADDKVAWNALTRRSRCARSQTPGSRKGPQRCTLEVTVRRLLVAVNTASPGISPTRSSRGRVRRAMSQFDPGRIATLLHGRRPEGVHTDECANIRQCGRSVRSVAIIRVACDAGWRTVLRWTLTARSPLSSQCIIPSAPSQHSAQLLQRRCSALRREIETCT